MKNSALATILFLTTTMAFAQQIPFSSQYYTNMMVTNPAFSGTGENTNVFITHRSQWIGITGSPQTSYLTVDGPIEAKNIGLGLKLYSDATDIISRMGAFANYSYKLKINDDNNLLIGVAVGILNNKIDFSKAVIRDTDDPYLFTQPQSKSVFSADFGLGYNWKKLQVGFCIPQVIGNNITYKTMDGKNSYYNLARHYQGSIKYVFDVIKDKEITAYPLIMVRGAAGTPLQYDVNAVLDWKKYGWIGITYHSNYAIAASIGVRYKNLGVGYAYDLGIGKMKSYTGSTSEFLLSYIFGAVKKTPELTLDNATQTLAPKNTVTDTAFANLKAKSDANEFQIEILTSEVQELKSKMVANANASSKNSENLTENLMRTGINTDFVDENGVNLNTGLYIVIGTFTNKDNATKLKAANVIKGYVQTMIMQNTKTKVYYVSVHKSDKLEEAQAELIKYKTEYSDIWIQRLQ